MSTLSLTNKLFSIVGILLILTGCMNTASQTNETRKKKNVLVIIADDLNKTLGCYGHPIAQTPNLDELAARGIQFDHAYCNFAVCNPSRSSLLLGLRPETTTIQDNVVPIQSIIEDRITLPALFKQNGYYTAGLGKIFHTPEEKHNDHKAWDEMFNFSTTELGKQGEERNMTNGVLKWCNWRAAEGNDEDQIDGQTAKKASELIKAEREKPFFLAVGLHKPHDPFVAPKKYFDLYSLEECNPPLLPEGWEPPYGHTLPGETSAFNKFSDQDKREFLRSYYACTSFMDAQVGKLIAALEESGQMENTLIVFFGDHGYHLGEHNWWNKVTLFEQGTGAPFIMAGAGINTSGAKSEAMFEYIDIYPTLAELLELENTPEYLEGKSFAAVTKDPSQSFRTEVRALIRRGEMRGKSVKNEKWRYVEWDNGNRGVELYDQMNDPLEYKNLAENPEYSEVLATMKEFLHKDN